MPIKKKSALAPTSTLRKGPGRGTPSAGAEEDEEEEEAPTAKPGSKVKTKPGEGVANDELVSLFETYDEHVAKAEQVFVELVELIQDKQLDRNTVIMSMMLARGISFESAQTQYSRMKKIFNNEEVLQELKEGKITLKVAREKTKTEQKNPKSAKPQAKEARYTSTLKSFVAAAKESGMARREIMIGVEAELKSAGIR